MPTPKPKKPAAKPKPATPAPAALPPETTSSGLVLTRLRTRWPTLTSPDRAAFASLATDAQRSALGRQTKAEKVLSEGIRWAVQMDADLREHPAATECYTEARFAYFLERLHSLHRHLTQEKSARTQQDQQLGATLGEREQAKAARTKLIRRLERFAGLRVDEKNALAAVKGTTEPDEELATSINHLANLGEQWAARSDEVSRRLVLNAGLTPELLASSRAAAKALSDSTAGAAMAGPREVRDSPPVNREEGGVLLEMEEAMICFDEAREEHPTVRRLVPGPSIRHALGYRKPHAEAAAPAEEPAAPAKEPAPPAK